jgi:hypothetical protein
MCALCGLFGSAGHWTEASANPQVFGAQMFGTMRTRRAERAEQVRLANSVLRLFALRLDDWQGSRFVLSGPTGRRVIAATLPDVWKAASSMLGRPINPLDPTLLARLATSRP